MCQYLSEGGRRCPVHRNDSMATIRHATKTSGLPRETVEHMFVELRKEGRSMGRGNAEVQEWTDYMRTLEESAPDDKIVSKNIAEARNGDNAPSKATLYALQRLNERACDRSNSLRRYLKKVASTTGRPTSQLVQDLDAAARSRNAAPATQADIDEFRRKNLPVDSKTAAALKSVASVDREDTRRVKHQDVTSESSALQSVGYDPEDGRLEVRFKRNPETTYAYRNVPSDVWDAISPSGSMYVYSHTIRGNPDYTYDNAGEAEAEAYRVRCASCGQFRASSHQCPEKTAQASPGRTVVNALSQEAITQRGATEMRDRWEVPGNVVKDPLYPTSEEIYTYTEVSNVLNHVTEFHTVDDSKSVRNTMDEFGRAKVPVKAVIEEGEDAHTVEGVVTIAENEDRYTHEAKTIGSDLRCSCPAYEEHYTCKHVRAIATQSSALLYQDDDEYVNLSDSNKEEFEVGFSKELETAAEMRLYAQNAGLNDVPYSELEEAYLDYKENNDDVIIAEDTEQYREFQAGVNAAPADEVRLARRRLDPQIVRDNEENNRNYQEALMKRRSVVEPGYGNNPELFHAHYEAAAKAPIPYEYDNVLDGATDGPGGRSFGVELEIAVKDGENYHEVMETIGRRLHEANLTDSPDQKEYHAASKSGWSGWSFEEDTTVDGEIVSPLLKDDPKSWGELASVCEIIKSSGGTVDMRCGSHIHISSGSYDLSSAKHAELQRNTRAYEDVLYRVSTNPYAKSKIHRGVGYCTPNTIDTDDDIPLKVEESHHLFNATHGNNLNMEASGQDDSSRSHVEFRAWDGSLDPGTIQQQIKVSMAMVDQAEHRVISQNGSPKKSDSEKVLLGESLENEKRIMAESGVSKHTPETLMRSNESTVQFLDTIFRRQEDRKSVLALFAKNSWQRGSKEQK